MTLLQMRYYYEVCRLQSITKAAASLHVAQPTLSIAMQTIEKTTGLTLFRHIGRNIQITEDGQTLFTRISYLLESFDCFESDVRSMAHKQNRIRLAVPPQIGTRLLPRLLKDFRQAHPEIRLEIIEPTGLDALQLVKNEELSLAITYYGQEKLDDLTYHELFIDQACLCINKNHLLAQKATVSLAEIAHVPLIMLNQNYHITQLVLKAFAATGLQPDILHYSPHLATIQTIIQQGIAASILTSKAISPNDSIIAIPLPPQINIKGCIITKKNRQLHASEKILMSFVQDVLSYDGK